MPRILSRPSSSSSCYVGGHRYDASTRMMWSTMSRNNTKGGSQEHARSSVEGDFLISSCDSSVTGATLLRRTVGSHSLAARDDSDTVQSSSSAWTARSSPRESAWSNPPLLPPPPPTKDQRYAVTTSSTDTMSDDWGYFVDFAPTPVAENRKFLNGYPILHDDDYFGPMKQQQRHQRRMPY